jgi:hypothetical protein
VLRRPELAHDAHHARAERRRLVLANLRPTRRNRHELTHHDSPLSSLILAGTLVYSRDRGHWPDRRWHETEAALDGHHLTARLPPDASAAVFTATAGRGASASSPHLELAPS